MFVCEKQKYNTKISSKIKNEKIKIMENNQEQKIKKVLAAVLAIVFFLSVFALAKTLIYDKTKNKSNLTEDKKNEGKLFSSPSFLEIYPMESVDVKIFFTPKNSQETIDVTKKTTLLSGNPEMVNVSMAEETYGQVVAQKKENIQLKPLIRAMS